MNNRTIPTLSAKGWLKDGDVAERLDHAMSYAFTSDNSQSVTFAGKIVSIQWVISKYNKNITQLQSSIQKTLEDYLKKLFDSVDLHVEIKEDGAKLEIVTRGVITNNGKSQDMQYLITVRNSTIEKVTNVLNDVEG
tara:strand:+ start:93395 stop:93802 length:408 start_codon:yes stop_codon:yes gene_type:complete